MFWQFGRDPVNPYDRTRFSHFTADLGSNVTLVTNATVLRINATESATAVESVEFAAVDGRRWTLPAATVVLCGGGIENARLLLSSDNVAAHGLGNDRDLVGRFLMDHIRTPVASFRPGKTAAPLRQFASFKSPAAGNNLFQHGMRLSPAIQRAERLLNCSAWIEEHIAPDDPWESLFIRFLRREPGSGRMSARCWRTAACSPRAQGALHLRTGRCRGSSPESRWKPCANRSRTPIAGLPSSDRRDRLGMRISRIDWRVSDEEARAMRRMAELMVEQFSRMGIDPPELEDWVRDGAMFPQTVRGRRPPDRNDPDGGRSRSRGCRCPVPGPRCTRTVHRRAAPSSRPQGTPTRRS